MAQGELLTAISPSHGWVHIVHTHTHLHIAESPTCRFNSWTKNTKIAHTTPLAPNVFQDLIIFHSNSAERPHKRLLSTRPRTKCTGNQLLIFLDNNMQFSCFGEVAGCLPRQFEISRCKLQWGHDLTRVSTADTPQGAKLRSDTPLIRKEQRVNFKKPSSVSQT